MNIFQPSTSKIGSAVDSSQGPTLKAGLSRTQKEKTGAEKVVDTTRRVASRSTSAASTSKQLSSAAAATSKRTNSAAAARERSTRQVGARKSPAVTRRQTRSQSTATQKAGAHVADVNSKRMKGSRQKDSLSTGKKVQSKPTAVDVKDSMQADSGVAVESATPIAQPQSAAKSFAPPNFTYKFRALSPQSVQKFFPATVANEAEEFKRRCAATVAFNLRFTNLEA